MVKRLSSFVIFVTLLAAPVFAGSLDYPRSAPPVPSTAKEASHVIKAGPGNLLMLMVTSDSDQYILLMNSATLPADGAVALLHPPIHVAAHTTVMIDFKIPLRASLGITVCNSDANTFVKTIQAADCIFTAQVE